MDVNERTFLSYTYPILFTDLPIVSAAGAGSGYGTGVGVLVNAYIAYKTKLDFSTYSISSTTVHYSSDIRCRMIALGI